MMLLYRVFGLLLASRQAVQAIELDITKPDSIKSAASRIAYDMMSNYKGNISGDPWNIPGLLAPPPDGYYWWEAGAMFGSMIDYWYYTGDTSYNEVVEQAMLFQANSPADDYKPLNQSRSLGNDDQAFWGMAAMSAAETNFPNPPKDSPQWLALAQAVFNTQAVQYDIASQTCGGGLRWQIFSFNAGYTYKNSISNGCFFNLGARLARYTSNTTYLDWAEKAYQWCEDIGLIQDDYAVFDGTDEKNNCSDFDRNRWSYNVGVFLLGAANMYNYSAEIDPTSIATVKWKTRTEGLLNATSLFFLSDPKDVMIEGCEAIDKCNTDQRSFKAYLARWMAATTKVASFTTPYVLTKLRASAIAAVKTCTGGGSGTLCGHKWTQGAFDGQNGVGEQMSALEVVQGLLIEGAPAPLTNMTGGTSVGNPNAGSKTSDLKVDLTVTTADRAGAWLLTTILMVAVVGGTWWMAA